MRPPAPITPSSLFVISGGGRGITARCAVTLAQRYRCRLLLLGRTELMAAEESAFPSDADEAELKAHLAADLKARDGQATPRAIQQRYDALLRDREVRRTLADIAAAGGEAEYLTADVTHGESLRRTLQPVLERLGPVSGLIHGAGVTRDKLVQHKRVADLEAVYRAKVLGLEHLLGCLPAEHLSWLVLFASAAGFFGNAGQTDYALANEVLNRAAHRLQARHPGCRVIAFNWGPWAGGMVTPEVQRRLADRQVPLITPEVGTAAFVRALEQPRTPVQLLVGGGLEPEPPQPPTAPTTRTLVRRLSLAANPFAIDHVIDGRPVLPAACAVAWLARAAEQLHPGFHFAAATELRVLKGIIFDGSLADAYQLQIDELGSNEAEVRCLARVKSLAANGPERFHYSGSLLLRRSRPASVRLEELNLEEDATARDGSELYGEGRLFHGPAFQGIERVLSASEEGITLRCRLSALHESAQGQFPAGTYHPYWADVQLQSVLVWALMLRGVAGHPLHLEAVEVLTTPRFDQRLYVTTRIRAASDSAIIGDSVLHDADGLVYMRHRGAELTPSGQVRTLQLRAMV